MAFTSPRTRLEDERTTFQFTDELFSDYCRQALEMVHGRYVAYTLAP